MNRARTHGAPRCTPLHRTRRHKRRARLLCVALAACTLAGCEFKRVTIADTFPKGSYASPWVLRGTVWTGSLEEASAGLGEEAERWAAFEPERVWLAVYRHDTYSSRTLTARAWTFSSAEKARRAFEHFRPPDAAELEAGEQACWMRDGVLVLWGRMVWDIFARDSAGVAAPEQAVYLLAFFEKQMPAGLPNAPQ